MQQSSGDNYVIEEGAARRKKKKMRGFMTKKKECKGPSRLHAGFVIFLHPSSPTGLPRLWLRFAQSGSIECAACPSAPSRVLRDPPLRRSVGRRSGRFPVSLPFSASLRELLRARKEEGAGYGRRKNAVRHEGRDVVAFAAA